jgi:K+-sensing histidine kinase KdpD
MLQHLLPRVVASQRELTPEADIHLKLAPRLPAVMASETHVAHAVRNLLDHAQRYSPEGTVVDVQVRRTNGSVEVSISDHGPGRDDVAAGRAFDLFATSDRTARDASGANLALVVARHLVTRMGGRIRAATAASGEVTLSLPIAREAR